MEEGLAKLKKMNPDSLKALIKTGLEGMKTSLDSMKNAMENTKNLNTI